MRRGKVARAILNLGNAAASLGRKPLRNCIIGGHNFGAINCTTHDLYIYKKKYIMKPKQGYPALSCEYCGSKPGYDVSVKTKKYLPF